MGEGQGEDVSGKGWCLGGVEEVGGFQRASVCVYVYVHHLAITEIIHESNSGLLVRHPPQKYQAWVEPCSGTRIAQSVGLAVLSDAALWI